MEAALLIGAATITSSIHAMGHPKQDLARVPSRSRHRLVGRFLRKRAQGASHRAALRRLPLGQLRAEDARRCRVERRLRKKRCHGPGSDQVAKPARTNVVNPARLDYVRANDVCIQCHSQGRLLTNPLEGRQYDWPAGYTPGERLSRVWQLEEHKLGETSFTHFPDGTAVTTSSKA